MIERRTESEKIHSSELESSLLAFSRKLTELTQRKSGSVLVRLTDSGEEYAIEMIGGQARLTREAPATSPLVEVSGSSTVLKAIIDGEKEARRAYIAGGIRVQGDLPYLENLLRELGLLECP
jgi:putative sterol carrier protein